MYESVFEEIHKNAEYLGIKLSVREIADLVSTEKMSEDNVETVRKVFKHLQEKQYETTVEFLLRTSKLPGKEPKTFANFDFSRIRGKDAPELEALKTLSQLYAGTNIGFIGNTGVGKTHLAMAYARECCKRGMKAYFIKASQLNQRFLTAIRSGKTDSVIKSFVKPTCLVIDEVGRCVFDTQCTDMFFNMIDRRSEKAGPNTTIFTSNTMPMDWGPFFEKKDTLLCSLDRAFDDASVFIMKGESYRGRKLVTYAVEAKDITVTLK